MFTSSLFAFIPAALDIRKLIPPLGRTRVTMVAYLIFVTNAVNAVRVKILAECKKIPEERENYCFGLRLYRSSECIILNFAILYLVFGV